MKTFTLVICMGIILIFSQASQAQHLLKLSDKGCVELSLDMIRRGVQQEDTARVMKVIGANVLVRGLGVKTRNFITQDLDNSFANSSKRLKVEGSKALPKPDTGLRDSNLWDFDILSPKITIKGDSAIVDCELVLWEALSVDVTKAGSRITERLVFWSPFKDQPNKTASNNPLRWQLVECNNLFDFLAKYGDKSVQQDDSNEVQK